MEDLKGKRCMEETYMEKSSSVDMIHGPLAGKLTRFALPIALSGMLQQLFNAADTSVVGHFTDANALAAVGTNGEIVALLVTLASGLAVGANVLIARMIGERNPEAVPDAVHTSILLAVLLGISGMIVGWITAGPLLTVIRTPAEVMDGAVIYLKIYYLGYPSLMLYNFGSAVLRAKGDSRRPFFALTLSGIINILLNLFFVVVCGLGVSGVAGATSISTTVSAVLVLIWLFREPGEFRLSFHQMRFHGECVRSVLMIGIPAAVQGAVFCFANIFVQASVNSFGAIAAAGSTIAMNFEYFGYYMITAFGQTATTFTSQNFAAGEKKRCLRILWLCLIGSAVFSAAVTVPLTIWRDASAALFTSDPLVIKSACLRIILILAFEPICGFYEVPAGVMRGMGYSALPAVLTVIGTCFLRIAWIFTVFACIRTQESLFVVFPLSWVVTIILTAGGFFLVWRKENR